jgi:hypothetical protein
MSCPITGAGRTKASVEGDPGDVEKSPEQCVAEVLASERALTAEFWRYHTRTEGRVDEEGSATTSESEVASDALAEHFARSEGDQDSTADTSHTTNTHTTHTTHRTRDQFEWPGMLDVTNDVYGANYEQVRAYEPMPIYVLNPLYLWCICVLKPIIL